jgi:Tfp pilus assembly protein PilP
MRKKAQTMLVSALGSLLLLAALVTTACDDSGTPPPAPPASPPPAAAPPAPGGAPDPGAVAAPGGEKAAEAVPSEPTEPLLAEQEFIEGGTNRDPFRSFISQFAQPTKRVVKLQRKVILPRYAVDELKLIAVVTGGARPRAMFRDPTGLGVTVKRGDYLGKNASKIKQILTDKVVLELTERSEDQNTQIDRVIDLYPAEDRKPLEEMLEVEVDTE